MLVYLKVVALYLLAAIIRKNLKNMFSTLIIPLILSIVYSRM